MQGAAKSPAGEPTATTVSSEDGRFNLSYKTDPEPIPPNRIHTWTLTINGADGRPVEDAAVTVVGDMPEHGHGLPTQPEVRWDSQKGTYRVEGMKFNMPGLWIVTFHVKAGDVRDSASFVLRIP